MWNSPYNLSESGKRYRLEDISVLVYGLGGLRDHLPVTDVSDLVDEAILRRLEKDEFTFVLYQVFQALLEEVAVPEGGHTGVQEAMIAELLSQTHASVVSELEMEDFGHDARKTVWSSVDRLMIQRNPEEPCLPWILEDAGMKLSDPTPYLSEKMTPEMWEELLLSEDFLMNEFLWDTDWRMDSFMDAHPEQAAAVSKLAGLNLDVVQALPHTPNVAELDIAQSYINDLLRKDEELNRRLERVAEAEEGRDDAIPF